MKRSVSELSAILAKAARGAGLPLGVCEELSAAAPWLGTASVDVLADLLESKKGRAALIALSEALDALACGHALGDLGKAAKLAPALASARGLALSAHVTPPARGPLEINRGSWQKLDVLAARTYVPATEASRLRGAGAGVIDND